MFTFSVNFNNLFHCDEDHVKAIKEHVKSNFCLAKPQLKLLIMADGARSITFYSKVGSVIL